MLGLLTTLLDLEFWGSDDERGLRGRRQDGWLLLSDHSDGSPVVMIYGASLLVTLGHAYNTVWYCNPALPQQPMRRSLAR